MISPSNAAPGIAIFQILLGLATAASAAMIEDELELAVAGPEAGDSCWTTC